MNSTQAHTPNTPHHDSPVRHVVQFSGGVGSALSAVRVVEQHGPQNMTLLIADTQVEDPDLWRFSREFSDLIEVPLTIVADGRTPWQLFHDVRFLGNDRLAPCTRHLKQIPCRTWMQENAPPETSVAYIGIEPTKKDRPRAAAITRNWAPWRVEYPLLDGPDRTKPELLNELRSLGIRPPRLYDLGFEHNNCGGMCVRAGQRQWKRLLTIFPDRYAHAEEQEEALRSHLNKDVSILKRQRGTATIPLTLRDLRREEEAAG
ncbi:hypothetical protein ACFV9E_11960 [Streptomyces sp. NPDC059835]|uniref:hypothetical protein n=1 Tax=Streptomyces sp. NPDC059835 TaxID=3346967 RepID=UPI0036666CA3